MSSNEVLGAGVGLGEQEGPGQTPRLGQGRAPGGNHGLSEGDVLPGLLEARPGLASRPALTSTQQPTTARWDAAAPVRTGGGQAVVVGVVGARGGAGASTLAALTAARLARRTSTVLVDLDPAGGGLDVTVGIEDVDGARWPELAGARGDVPGQDVLALLPRWEGCAVLSADRDGLGPDTALVADVLHALAGVVGAVVLDLPRGGPVAAAVLPACDVVALVARRDLRSVAGTLALRPQLATSRVPVGLVVVGRAVGGLSVGELGAAVDLPVLWSGRARAGLARAAERGVLPRRGPAVRAARAVAAQAELVASVGAR